MGLKSAYFQEEKRYTKADISSRLCASEDITKVLDQLTKGRILQAEPKSAPNESSFELSAEEIKASDFDIKNADQFYKFNFVGIVTIDKYVLICYPKYINRDPKPVDQMKQMIRVLRRYHKSKIKPIFLSSGADEETESDMLSIVLFIIDDYISYGAYNNQKDITEINGEGEIDWDKTVSETYPFIINNKPYYLEYFTNSSVNDDSDYFRCLHQCIVTECSKSLDNAGLTEIFSLASLHVHDGDLSDFGSDEHILYRLKRELNVQFVTSKQLLLKTMSAYISSKRTLQGRLGISIYGKTDFEFVWEKACTDVFSDLRNTKLDELPHITLKPKYTAKRNNKLIDLIEKTKWKPHEIHAPIIEKDTMEPDIISIYQAGEKVCFGIFDAKYYDIFFTDSRVDNNPGIQDVTKQYLYQLAYNDFIQDHAINKVVNVFLFPGDDGYFPGDDVGEIAQPLGTVELEMFTKYTTVPPGLEKITAVRLKASYIFDRYLSGKPIEISRELPFL